MTTKGEGLGFPSRSILATRRDSVLTAPMWLAETERRAQISADGAGGATMAWAAGSVSAVGVGVLVSVTAITLGSSFRAW